MLRIAGSARYIDHLQTSKLTNSREISTNKQIGNYNFENLSSLKCFGTQVDENIQITRAEFNDLKLKLRSP